MLAGKGMSSGTQSVLDDGDLGAAQGSRGVWGEGLEGLEDMVREVMGALSWGMYGKGFCSDR